MWVDLDSSLSRQRGKMTQYYGMEQAELSEESMNNTEATGQGIIRNINGMESLLIAEDCKAIRLVLKKILESTGYKVFVADNGKEAVTLFKEHREISLVLSDLDMPGKIGKEITDDIREISPGIKALFISVYPADIIHEQGLIGESDEFMTKPFNVKDLVNKIRYLLNEE
jgi:CheY-like chemotaxis protein